MCSWLQRLVDAHEQFKMTIGEADKEFNAIMALIQEVHRICQQYGISIGHENPYSYITGQDLTTKWHEVKQLVPDRDMVLRNELMRQQNNERLRRAFAQKANVVGQWIERHLDAVATASMQRGKLEENLSRLYALDKEVAAFRPSIDELERYNQDIHEAMIFDNRHTPYTMEVGRLRTSFTN